MRQVVPRMVRVSRSLSAGGRLAVAFLPTVMLGVVLIGSVPGAVGVAQAAEIAPLDRRVWQHLPAVPSALPLTGFAAQPGEGGSWLTADASGAVWLSTDAGLSWELVLEGDEEEGPDDDEALLLEAEAASEAGEDAETASALALREARGGGLMSAAARNPGTPWWHPGEPDIVLIGRPDGIWRSRDGGTVFQQVWEVGASGFALGPDGVLIAGTNEGVLYSTDAGATWIDVVDETDEIPVNAVIEAHGKLYAATVMGLYSSTDGVRWSLVTGLPWGPVAAVVADPAWKGGLWAATASGLMRTDDGGANFYAAGRQPMKGLRGLGHRGGAGQLLAWGEDGVWASDDGGVSWTPQARLLTEPDVRGLAVVGGELVIVTPGGLWRFVAPPEIEDLVVRHEVVMPMRDAVALAVDRPGLDTSVVALANNQALVRLVPNLEVGFKWADGVERYAYLIDRYTIEPSDDAWELWARLCWGGCATTSSTGADLETYDALESAIADAQESGDTSADALDDASSEVGDTLEAEDAIAEAADSLYVVGDAVYGADTVVSAAANVSQQILRYRTRLGADVAETWSARQRLAEERSLVGTQSLQAQVEHELKIQEIDARLDLWTNGQFTRSIQIIEDKP